MYAPHVSRQSSAGWIIIALLAGLALAGTWIGIVLATAPAHAEVGSASWYGPGFHGHRMANGQRFNQWSAVCAHKRLPFGSVVRVTNLANGHSAICRVADRGPFVRGRIIDVSRGVAAALNMLGRGVARVRVDILH